MRLFVLTLFVVGIGSSSVSLLPPGCGESIIQACNAMRPYLDCRGQTIVDKLNEGVAPLRTAIRNGDIKTQSALFKDVGARGMMQLTNTTNNACLKHTFFESDKIDKRTSNRLQSIRDPAKAGHISCNTLNSKAKWLNSCIE